MIKFRTFGEWEKVNRRILGLEATIRAGARFAMRMEGERLRQEMIEGLISGRPAGQALAPLSPLTLLLRRAQGLGGNTPLYATGRTIQQLAVVESRGRVWVGVQGDRARTLAMHAEGAPARTLTLKQRRFLMVMLRRAGVAPGEVGSGAGGFALPQRNPMQLLLEQVREDPAAAERFAKNFEKGTDRVFRR